MLANWGRIAALAACFAASTVAATAPASAQTVDEAFFKGKTVRFMVGFGPGGGYDAYARMIAPYLAKALDANVVVENQPGAGGMTALNRIATAEPDGLRLMIVQGVGAALSQISNAPGLRYDLAALGHLGTVSASPWMWIAGPNAKFDHPREIAALGRPLLWGGSGPTDGSSDGASFTCEALRLNCKIVVGYRGSNDIALAVAKGEMDSLYLSDTSVKNFVAGAPELRVVASMNRKRSRFFPNTPTIHEMMQLDAQQAWVLDFHSTIEDLGRILVTTPGLPPGRLAALRKAVETSLKTPALIEEGEKTQRYIDFVDGETTRAQVVKVVADITPDQRKLVQTLIARIEGK